MNFVKNFGIQYNGDAVAAGSSIDDDSTVIDMANRQGVTFITPITDSVATGVATMTLQTGTASDGSDMADTTATATATCAINDDLNGTLLVIECDRPQKRYVRVNRASATANIAYGAVTAIVHGDRTLPITDHSTVSDVTLSVEP